MQGAFEIPGAVLLGLDESCWAIRHLSKKNIRLMTGKKATLTRIGHAPARAVVCFVDIKIMLWNLIAMYMGLYSKR
jgi:hypothetical protein